MRFSLASVDLEVPRGLSLHDARHAAARLTGDPRVTAQAWWVEGRRLDEDHVAGVVPWVHGAQVDLGVPGPDPVVLAHRAGWHLAVVDGPGAGELGVPGQGARLAVGRGLHERTVPGRLGLDDTGVSREHALVRRRGRRRPRWTVQDLGSANGTLLRRAGGRRERTVGRRPARVRPGDDVVVGESVLRLRSARSVPERAPGGSVPRGGTGRALGSGQDTGPGDLGHRSPRPVSTASWLVPALTSIALAAAMRNPVFLLLGLVGPLTVLLPTTLHRVSRRRRPAGTSPPLGSDAPGLLVHLAGGDGAGGHEPLPAPWTAMAREGLAVVGPPDRTRAVGRALVAGALAAGPTELTLLHPATADPHWAWARWLAPRLGGSGDDSPGPDGVRVARTPTEAAAVLQRDVPSPHLVVADQSPRARPALHRWWLDRHRAQDSVLLLAEHPEQVPGWCRWVLQVDGPGRGRLAGPVSETAVDLVAGTATWAERVARRLAVRGDEQEGTASGRGTDLPTRVGLVDLDLPDRPEGIAARWATPRAGLVAPLGTGATGQVTVDLVTDGPHALVAGTTGAGKSELLQSLVLGLALSHPPDRLSIVLVDYKGGTGLGPCPDLPHVVGRVTDLDATEAARALDGLRIELGRRKAVLAAAGAATLEDLDPQDAPPRLLVVVDELRAMTEDLPDFVPGLVHLAAQGRSLGIHLVLATQRPAGVVDAQMRANVSLRVALRVADPADSTDLLDVPDAAHLPADRPGRALLRRGPARPELVQTAWAALDRADHDRPHLAAPWSASGPRLRPPEGRAPRDHATSLVEACRAAAEATGHRPGPAPWLPALPQRVGLEELTGRTDDASCDGLVLGLADRPAWRSREVARWRGDGVLIVAGRTRSGRSTTLATLARGALDGGITVHAVHGSPAPGLLGAQLAEDAHPLAGTVVGAGDPRRVARLLALLLTEPPTSTSSTGESTAGAGTPPDRLLVIDDLGEVQRGLELLPRGAGLELLDRVLRGARRHGTAVVVGCLPHEATRLVPHATARLVLPVDDPHDAALLGVPTGSAGASGTTSTGRPALGGRGRTDAPPGRGVLLDAGDAVECQVAVAGPPPARHPPLPGGPAPVRLAPLPLLVRLEDVGGPDGATRCAPAGEHGSVLRRDPAPLEVVLGLGGDRATPVLLPLQDGVLVVGPPGSGRTTALETLVHGVRALGWAVQVGPPPALPAPADAGHLGTGLGSRTAYLLDDLDVDLRTDQRLADHLAAVLSGPRPPVLLASCRTGTAASAFRGPLALLRESCVVVLSPSSPGSGEVAGTDLALVTDPMLTDHPGRGAVAHRGRTLPVQVARQRPGGAAGAGGTLGPGRHP
ncbi:FHA domain-containing protein [Actinotalea sp. BY-33]|uniref:FHA domain-containing protein n=1 Tax=Actinotalea soli TaxID=2819234 RepID=A0A939LP07_9CELL|nr:FtsK/SpoIIIE domain-containing protein [Actinotalea soli]MBO1750978.1 FHA domain-containing protein [Actinotalea soli]